MNQLLLQVQPILYSITLIRKLKHIEYICCDGVMCVFGKNKHGCLGSELRGGFNKISL